MAHLSEEGDEEERAAVGVDHGVDAVELSCKAGCLLHKFVRGWASEGADGSWWCFEKGRSEDSVEVDAIVGAGYHAGNSLVVGWEEGVGEYEHNHEAHDVHPDGGVGQPTQTLQRSDHAQQHTDHHEDNHAGNKADAVVGQLGDGLAAGENQDGDSHELLQ